MIKLFICHDCYKNIQSDRSLNGNRCPQCGKGHLYEAKPEKIKQYQCRNCYEIFSTDRSANGNRCPVCGKGHIYEMK